MNFLQPSIQSVLLFQEERQLMLDLEQQRIMDALPNV